MNVTIRNRDIWSTRPGQQTPMLAAFDELSRLQVGRLASLKMRRIARVIQQQAEDIESERQRILETFGERDKEGNLLEDEDGPKVKQEGRDAFRELVSKGAFEVEALLASEIHKLDDILPWVLIGLGDLFHDDVSASENGNTPKQDAAAKRQARRR